MNKLMLPVLLAASLLVTTTPLLADSQDDHGGVLSIAVFGDSPYGVNNADTAQFIATPAFIQSINADPDVSLVLNVGDLHSGKQICTKAYDQSIYDMWIRVPLPRWCTRPATTSGPIATRAAKAAPDPMVKPGLCPGDLLRQPGAHDRGGQAGVDPVRQLRSELPDRRQVRRERHVGTIGRGVRHPEHPGWFEQRRRQLVWPADAPNRKRMRS